MKAKAKFRPLASLDTLAWALIRGIWAYVLSTEITCAGPYKLRPKLVS